MTPIDISVILSTYNRADLLPGAIGAFLQQNTQGVTFEVILVDNNSTDNTKEVAGNYATSHPGLIKYVFEPKQGLSHGRNAGIANAQGKFLAFTDDDVRVHNDWINALYRAFNTHPDAVYIGGKVLPLWQTAKPKWAHLQLASLALQDYGREPQTIDSNHQRCLIGANLACRKELIELIGGFDPATQRVKEGIGSMEDYEWQTRIWAQGLHGKYVPDVQVSTPVQEERLRKWYHREWHFRHGIFSSILRDPLIEATSWRIFDTPGHVYRGIANSLFSSVVKRLQLDPQDSFRLQCEALDRLGFMFARWRGCLFPETQESAGGRKRA
jgi:glycosyltransferase involved in cell wall biosynthesis